MSTPVGRERCRLVMITSMRAVAAAVLLTVQAGAELGALALFLGVMEAQTAGG